MKPTSYGFSTVVFYNSKGQVLLQDRKEISKWGEEYGLFGGSLQEREGVEEGLLRELQEELEMTPKNLFLFKQYTYHNSQGRLVSGNIFTADLPDLSGLKCNEGKMELRTFQNSLNLKFTQNIGIL